jgi:hypothetical protein
MNTIWADAVRRVDTQADRLARRRAARGLPPTRHLREVVEKRTLTSKTYWRGGDSYRLIVGMKPKHVPLDVAAWQRDGAAYTGGWADIDSTWSMVNGRLESGVGWNRVTVDPSVPCAITYASLLGGSATMRMTGIDLRPVPPMQIREGLRWADVAEDFDVELHLYPHGVEWFKRIKSAMAPRAWTWELEQTADFAAHVNWHALGWDNADHAERQHESMFFRQHRQAQTTMIVRSDDGRRIVVDEAWTGKVMALEPVTRIKVLTADVVYPVWIDFDVVEPVAADADDVQERVDYSDVEILGGPYGNRSRAGASARNAGWRFTTIALDQGVTIDNTTILQVQVTTTESGGVTSTVSADDVDDAAAWANGSRPSQITPTTATVSFAQTSSGLKSLDVTAIVQEIVNRGSWASGNDMRFAALSHTGTGTEVGHSGDLTDSNGAVEAVLSIDFTAAGGGSSRPPARRGLMGVGR